MKVNLLGVEFDQVTLAEAVNRIDEMIQTSGFHQVATMNPEYLVRAQEDQRLKQAINKMDLVVADGIGIILVARWFVRQPTDRSTGWRRIRGGDLVEALAEISVQKGYKIGLIGAGRGVGQRALTVLQKKYPGLQGFSHSTRFGAIRLMKKEKPQIVLTALGFQGPVWLEKLRQEKLNLVGLEVGGVFNYLAGISRRPPRIITGTGLEWLWRLVWEPWRLKRQLKLLKFLRLVLSVDSQQPKDR